MNIPEQQEVIDTSTLQKQLEDAGIDISQWGVGKAKTLEHLQTEIREGETRLEMSEEGGLLRRIVVGGADIYYQSPEGIVYRLTEHRQVFRDGREKRRDTDQAVSEKFKPDESPMEAIRRGVQEELGITGDLEIERTGTGEKRRISNSYPGLETKYVYHLFKVWLTDEQYHSDGYIEKQRDKSTYFTWEEVVNNK